MYTLKYINLTKWS